MKTTLSTESKVYITLQINNFFCFFLFNYFYFLFYCILIIKAYKTVELNDLEGHGLVKGNHVVID